MPLLNCHINKQPYRNIVPENAPPAEGEKAPFLFLPDIKYYKFFHRCQSNV